MLHVRVITPKKVIKEIDADSVTVPGSEGEMTILPHHTNIFSMLQDGLVTIRNKSSEESFAIGSGYLETNGKDLNILVSRAAGQDELDQKEIERAMEQAKQALAKAKDHKERIDATMLLRRSVVDSKLLRKRKSRMV